MTTKIDRSETSRLLGRAIGFAWTHSEKALRDAGVWRDEWVMQSTGAGGTLYIEGNEDATELFKIKIFDGHAVIEAVEEGWVSLSMGLP